MKTITIVEVNKVTEFPPVQNVIRALLEDGHRVNLVSRAVNGLPSIIKNNERFAGYEIPWIEENGIISKFRHRFTLNKYVREQTKELMRDSDYLWTTSIVTIRELRKDVKNYKHIFQLMELTRYGYLTALHIKYSLADIAQDAYCVIAAEINRAYIEKVWWNLKKVPKVLPNKPYSIDPGIISEEIKAPLEKIQNEKRKVILYLGGIFSDRDLEKIAAVLKDKEDYVLYIVGKAFTEEGRKTLEYLQDNYPVEYLGGFNPPAHLHFLKYAYLGVLPYKPVKTQSSDELNALYCAPNKIFEYAGFGVPMIGSDVLGLKLPFEQWNIGRCYDENSPESINAAIECVEANYDEMKLNCKRFYDSVDINKIVRSIVS